MAAWSMGFAVLAYLLLMVSGIWMIAQQQRQVARPSWLLPFHILTGIVMAALVLLLLAIGVVGTLGHYGSLGHSWHLGAGLIVVQLVLLSVWSAVQIIVGQPWAKPLHIGTNLVLGCAFVWVSLTGWDVVQKYLP